jgi:hypothetical protein
MMSPRRRPSRPSLDGTLWEGLALRRLRASADPDAAPRAVAIPAMWEDEAAAALAALTPGEGPASLPRAAEAWIAKAVDKGLRAGTLLPEETRGFAEAWRALLLSRRAVPSPEIWRGDAKAEARVVLNLPAFLEPEGGFDFEGYAEACICAVRLLDAWSGGKATRLRIGFADLAGLLAGIGLPYDSDGARQVAAGIAALTRGASEAESGRLAERLGAREPVALIWPAPPGETPLPGLAEAARAALDAAAGSPGLRHAALVALAPADAAEALLGVEVAGIAPAPGSTRISVSEARIAEAPTRAALAAARLAPNRVAAILAPPSETGRRLMAEAVLPFLHAPLPMPPALPAPAKPAPAPRLAPRRQSGLTMRVSVGGHRVTLRTAEDEDGQLREIAFTLAKEGAAYRSLMDGFAQAVSLGLGRGVPLAEYVDAFAYTRFGPAGTVEGDPDIPRATSVLDWAFRRLAMDYLGRRDLPQPEETASESLSTPAEQAPLLPLDLPRTGETRKRNLRLVG